VTERGDFIACVRITKIEVDGFGPFFESARELGERAWQQVIVIGSENSPTLDLQ
jgi:hypothetical protein